MESPSQDQKICTIDLSNGVLDNEYTIYESGRIKRFYDRHTYKGGQNRESWLSARELPEDIKKELIDRCPKEFLSRVKKILETK